MFKSILIFGLLNLLKIDSSLVTVKYCADGSNVFDNYMYDTNNCIKTVNSTYSNLIYCSENNNETNWDFYTSSNCSDINGVSVTGGFVPTNVCFLGINGISYEINCINYPTQLPTSPSSIPTSIPTSIPSISHAPTLIPTLEPNTTFIHNYKYIIIISFSLLSAASIILFYVKYINSPLFNTRANNQIEKPSIIYKSYETHNNNI
jgi:hypothetical protein